MESKKKKKKLFCISNWIPKYDILIYRDKPYSRNQCAFFSFLPVPQPFSPHTPFLSAVSFLKGQQRAARQRSINSWQAEKA
jgi:hypothetical protein